MRISGVHTGIRQLVLTEESDSTVSVHKGCNEQYRLNNRQLLSFFCF